MTVLFVIVSSFFLFKEGVLRNCPIRSNAPTSRNIVLITNLVVYAELLA